MKIEVEGTALEALVERGVIDALGEAGKTAVVTEVAKYLTSKNMRDPFGRNEASPLQHAMQAAAYKIAERVLTEKLQNDPAFVDAVEKLYADAAKHMFGVENRQVMVERLSTVMSEALSKDRYR